MDSEMFGDMEVYSWRPMNASPTFPSYAYGKPTLAIQFINLRNPVSPVVDSIRCAEN